MLGISEKETKLFSWLASGLQKQISRSMRRTFDVE